MKVLFVAPKSGSVCHAAKTIMLQRCDVETMTQCCGHNGRYKGKREENCVARGPNMMSCKNKQFTKNVSLHNFPSEPDRRNKWTKFVRRHRPGWNPSKQSHLCSVHFEESCFERMRVCKMTGQTRLPLVA